jgi:hypothetical protein
VKKRHVSVLFDASKAKLQTYAANVPSPQDESVPKRSHDGDIYWKHVPSEAKRDLSVIKSKPASLRTATATSRASWSIPIRLFREQTKGMRVRSDVVA